MEPRDGSQFHFLSHRNHFSSKSGTGNRPGVPVSQNWNREPSRGSTSRGSIFAGMAILFYMNCCAGGIILYAFRRTREKQAEDSGCGNILQYY